MKIRIDVSHILNLMALLILSCQFVYNTSAYPGLIRRAELYFIYLVHFRNAGIIITIALKKRPTRCSRTHVMRVLDIQSL